MTSVVSLRLPAVLERAIRQNADQSRMPTSDIVRLILMHAPDGQYSFSALPDVQQYLDAKLDIRLPEELVSRLRVESERLRISVSVYSRVILYAYYTKRLVFVEIGDRYTLAENHEQNEECLRYLQQLRDLWRRMNFGNVYRTNRGVVLSTATYLDFVDKD